MLYYIRCKKYCHILNFFFTPSAFTTLLSTFTKDYYMLHIRGAFKSQTTLCLPILKWNLLFYSFLVAGICCVTAGVIPSNQFEGRVLHDWFYNLCFDTHCISKLFSKKCNYWGFPLNVFMQFIRVKGKELWNVDDFSILWES